MSFRPLPPPLEAALSRLARRPSPRLLDLGCGEGTLPPEFLSPGLPFLGLDRVPPWRGSRAQVVGDALWPPFSAASFDLVLAGNLFRHVPRSRRQPSFLGSWLQLLRPGGILFILEDQPLRPRNRGAAGTEAQRAWANYTALQEFLARVDPWGRRPLLARDEFLSQLDREPGGREGWITGLQDNNWPVDTGAVLQMLAGDGGPPTGDLKSLVEDIRGHGLAHGQYWWAVFTAEER